jgi:uracil-DNA glycosylase family 4
MNLLQSLNDLSVEISACRLCDSQKILLKHGPPMNRGQGTLALVIGEQPGKTELKTGVAFSGAAGTRLMDWLKRAGLGNTREEILQLAYLTSLCKCSILRGSHFSNAARNCFPFLERQIDLICPKICLTLGAVPLRVLFDYNGPLDKLIGTVWEEKALVGERLFPVLPSGCKIVPLPHPSPMSRWMNSAANKERLYRVLDQIRIELRK